MDISRLFNSYLGMYIAQSICHALIAAVVVDRSIQAWGITSPLVSQRFRYIVILSSFISFPLYQIVNPQRGSASFRLEALFDVNRWLNLELWGKVPLSYVFLFIIGITVLISLFQEMIPIIKHTVASKQSRTGWEKAGDDSVVNGIVEELPGENPDVYIKEDEEPIMFTATGRNSAIFLSSGLLELLDMKQLKAVCAHEIAHIKRSKRPLILMLFLLRILMIFNPVVLVEFRRIVKEEEKICDDIAVSMTHNPLALAGSLKKLYLGDEDPRPIQIAKPSTLGTALEEYSHGILIKGRIERLEQETVFHTGGEWITFIITFLVIMVINYFVV
jgi:beta-lactamase regulating signal transducer with metallopeptidase domain